MTVAALTEEGIHRRQHQNSPKKSHHRPLYHIVTDNKPATLINNVCTYDDDNYDDDIDDNDDRDDDDNDDNDVNDDADDDGAGDSNDGGDDDDDDAPRI